MNTSYNQNDSKEFEIFLSQQDPSKLLSGKFVAKHLDMSMQTLYRRRKAGRIVCVKVDRNVRFEVQAVLKYIKENRAGVAK